MGDLADRLRWVADRFEELDRSQHHDRGTGDFDPTDTNRARETIAEAITALGPADPHTWLHREEP